MEGSGHAEIAVATGIKIEDASGAERPLELDEQRIAKKAKVEPEDYNADPMNTQGGSYSVTNPSAPPELKDGTDRRDSLSGHQQQQDVIPLNKSVRDIVSLDSISLQPGQQQPAIPLNMYGIPPYGLQGAAAGMNYQNLLLLSQSQSGNRIKYEDNGSNNGYDNHNNSNNLNNMLPQGAMQLQQSNNGNNNMLPQAAMPPQQSNNGNNNMLPQGAMPPQQQMWMNHPVLAQALGLNFYQKDGGAATMQNTASMAGFALQGGFMHPMPLDANMTGRSPTVIYMSCDNDSLSEYQCLVRKQIEVFEARREDVDSNAQGRNRPIVMGQVGIRCRHCTMLPPKHRARGAIYYPAKLYGLYQAAQNMASSHLCEHCQHVPPDVRTELLKLRDRKSSAGGGKKYWADGVRILGVFEDEDGLRYEKR